MIIIDWINGGGTCNEFLPYFIFPKPWTDINAKC